MPGTKGRQFVPSFTGDAITDGSQRDVRRAIDQLEDLRRGMLVSSPLVGAADLQVSEHMTVLYKGPGAHKLTLPLATMRGSGRSQTLLVVNAGAGSITIKPSGNDTLNGSATLLANATALLFSDGFSKWHSTLVNVGPGAGVLGGATSMLQSITLDAQGRVTAVTSAAAWQAKVTAADTTPDYLDPTLLVSADLTKTLNNAGANETLTFGLANAGAGAGGIGSHTAIPVTITLDAKGRVTGVTTQTTHVSIGASSDFTARDHIGRRPVANAGTNLVAGDLALSAGWGASATISNIVSGSKDTRGEFTVTSAGAGQAANPTITLTFKDGAYGAPPFAIVARNGGSQPTVVNTWIGLSATLTITFVGTPVAAQTYTFAFHVIG